MNPPHEDSASSADREPLRVGIVGAGRSRQGLGPYLAGFFERAGVRVFGVSGRDRERTEAVAGALSGEFAHPVVPFAGAGALAAAVDALVVACPVQGHLDGLDAALAAGVPCLCEKPLVAAEDAARGLERVRHFRERGLLLMENCQWPFVLPELLPATDPATTSPRAVAMRLSPIGVGRAMVEDSLSHVLSLVQALVALPPDAEAVDVVQSCPARDATENSVRFRIVGGTGGVDVRLDLKTCPQQPRPAWFTIDGARYERRIGEGYRISFVAPDGRTLNVRDPLERLVYGFVANLQANHRERIDALAEAIALRIRLYAGVLQALGR
ncbi:MAG TPA: hypothetical protein ENI87_13400 [bacterium]|nr:hypothetical protein [bacterium]